MSAKIIRLAPPTSAATFNAMARARHKQAIERRLAGDEEGYLSMIADVRGLTWQAAQARRRAERLAIQQEERRQLAAAADAVLSKAREDRRKKKD